MTDVVHEETQLIARGFPTYANVHSVGVLNVASFPLQCGCSQYNSVSLVMEEGVVYEHITSMI
jgi:hypothetical protein